MLKFYLNTMASSVDAPDIQQSVLNVVITNYVSCSIITVLLLDVGEHFSYEIPYLISR